MKEIENIKANISFGVAVKQKKEVEITYTNSLIPHSGHKVWEINKETLEVKEAKFSNTNYHIGAKNKKEIIKKNNCEYISALNKENALKKYKKGVNGGRISEGRQLVIF
jgi:hypothetical protein